MKGVLVAYPLAMGFALVYAGEHYATDVLLGWLYVWLVMAGVAWCERHWRTRRSANGAGETGLEPATLSLEGSHVSGIERVRIDQTADVAAASERVVS